MNHLDTFIIDLALIMAAAGVVTLIFKRFKLPVVLGYILAGFLISPNFVWLPTVVEMDNIETWANIGIVFLMFGLGLEFSFTKLKTVGHAAIVTAITVICGMVPLGYLVGRMLGWSDMNSVFLGCVISMSSTMVILKAYEEYHMKKKIRFYRFGRSRHRRHSGHIHDDSSVHYIRQQKRRRIRSDTASWNSVGISGCMDVAGNTFDPHIAAEVKKVFER